MPVRLETSFEQAKRFAGVERVTGIEPVSSAWKAEALPLSYTREVGVVYGWTRAIGRGGRI